MKVKSNNAVRSTRVTSLVRTSRLVPVYQTAPAPEVKMLKSAVPTPSEETITRLNQLGQEYPFCVSFRLKSNDTL